MPRLLRGRLGVLLALLLITVVIRAPITAVPPVLAQVAATLGLGPVGAGMLTTLPVACFGIFAFLTPLLTHSIGREATLALAALVLTAGLALRLVVTPVAFFAGTILIGLGIAVANVVIPAIARSRFADRLPLVMSLYTVFITGSGTIGAFLTVPLVNLGWSGPAAIGFWLGPAALGLAVWLVVGRRLRVADAAAGRSPRHHGTNPLWVVGRRLLPWLLAAMMGLQSLGFYTVLTWLPAQLTRQGWTVTQAGLGLGYYNVLGLLGAFLGPHLLAMRHAAASVVGLAAAYIVGLVLLLAGGGLVLVAVTVLGLCAGFALSVTLTAIAHQHDPADVPATSALAQGGGYLIAAVGPVVVGALFGATGAFVLPTVFLVAVLVVWGAVSVVVLRAERAPLDE